MFFLFRYKIDVNKIIWEKKENGSQMYRFIRFDLYVDEYNFSISRD